MRQTMHIALCARGVSAFGPAVSEGPAPVQCGTGAKTPAAQSGPGV
jgi:hypothetical protein